MAELPEISTLSTQMRDKLRDKRIADVALEQPKCSNVPAAELRARCAGASVRGVQNKGKWVFIALGNGENILLSLGMGADVLYFERAQDAAQKYQVCVDFTDGSGFTMRFWWFGKFLIASDAELPNEPNTGKIAPHPLDERFTYDYFRGLFTGKKGRIKAFLMDQKNIGGIGNMYMHDILFKSRLHPQRTIPSISEEEFKTLYESITELMRFACDKGGFAYEKDFYGKGGGFTADCFLVGYREKKPCPACGAVIEAIKTGSTSSYICPQCQKL